MDNNLESFEEIIQDSSLLKFIAQVPYEPDVDPVDLDPEEETIWSDLRKVIVKVIKRDGINKKEILPYEIEKDVFEDAVDNTYDDVANFYYWYFKPSDDRKGFILTQKPVNVLDSIRDKVEPTVVNNLEAMREAEEIPAEQDVDGLEERITDDLTRYIQNWADWYYDRKQEEAVDNYYELQGQNEAIYIDSDYGDATNLVDLDQFDGYTDVPYYEEPE